MGRMAMRQVVLAAMAWAACAGASFAAETRPTVANANPSAGKGAVELETAESSGISIQIAEDLAALFDDGATRRILPVVGRTASQNMWDLAWLRGIDLAIMQTDVLDAAREQHALSGAPNSFTYVANLYNEEFHLLAAPGIKTVGDLAHRRVNLGPRGSGTSVTAARLFDLLHIPIDPVYDRQDAALAKLRHGDLAAMAFVAGKPAPVFQGVQHDEGLHFVAVPLEEGIAKAYTPTALEAADYPALIAKDQPIETVAVGSLLAVARLTPGTERYRAVSNFVDVFFTEFPTLLEAGHHPKWREVNLAAELPGWTRFPPAQQWLDHNVTAVRQDPQDVAALFSKFLDTRQQALNAPAITDRQKLELFNQFQRWQAGQAR